MKSVVVILGMHRSGTSCLAGLLESNGLHLGDVKTYSPHNKKGNREKPLIFELLESVVNENGGGWLNPPSEIKWSTKQLDSLNKLIELYSEYDVWGFKDPRTLFTFNGWLESLPKECFKFVGSFRHPIIVARSLEKRNNIPLEDGIELWSTYNKRLLQFIEESNASVINFDLSRDEYYKSFVQVCNNIGLDTGNIDFSFYSKNLVSDVTPKMEFDLTDDILKLYSKLISYETL